MKVLVLTANFGGIDNVKPIPEQTVSFDFRCYDREDFLSHIGSDRLKSKYPKLCTHKLPGASEYDYYIWIDGRIEITSPKFVEECVRNLADSDLFIAKHPDRLDLASEFKYIEDHFKDGTGYLNQRYTADEILRIKNSVSGDLPLYACGIFARRNTEKMNSVFNALWEKCVDFGCFEQPWFSWAEKEFSLKYSSIVFRNEFFKLGKHEKQKGGILNHRELIQRIIDAKGLSSYLEIGIETGTCFKSIRCEKKIGIDLDMATPATMNVASDDFFRTNKECFDLIFIDGLHEAEQVERDIKNSLYFLTENGYIIVHDCNPEKEELQVVPRRSKVWTGDVWKAFVSMRSNPMLEMCTVNMDFGCGIIQKGIQKPLFVSRLEWDHFNVYRKDWLNLISVNEFMAKL